MKKVILLLQIFSLPLIAQFKPLDFSGYWRGTWLNNTFHGSDSAFVTVSINEIDSTITIIMDLKGNLFGGKTPDPATMTGTYNKNGFNVSGYSSYYGNMYFSGNASSMITGRLPDVPSPSIDSVNFAGNYNPDTLGLNFTAKYGGVDLASGIISLRKDTSVVVPVELTSFSASVVNDEKVELRWTTATESNNAGFEIQRRDLNNSQTGIRNSQWIKTGFVKGNGTATEPKSYFYVDKNQAGKYLYRLKQIDFNGSFNYSFEVAVSINSPVVFELKQNYPNPFNPSTSIDFSIPYTSKVTLNIYNLLGQPVARLVNEIKEAGNYRVNWTAVNLTSGFYFYSLHLEGIDGKKNIELTRKMLLLK